MHGKHSQHSSSKLKETFIGSLSKEATEAQKRPIKEEKEVHPQATSGQTSLGVTGEVRAGPQLSSVVSASTTEPVYSTSSLVHSESASWRDTSATFTAEVDPEHSDLKDSLPQQQGTDEETINYLFDHFIVGTNPSILVDKTKSARDGLETAHTEIETETEKETSSKHLFGTETKDDAQSSDDDEEIKMDDLTELVQKIMAGYMELESPRDDQPIQTIKIQELTNQVLFLQSQKYKLEKEKTDVEAKVANLKALPSYLNVQQLTELLVNSFKPEFVKLIKAHDFSSFIPTELKDLPRKFKAMNETLALTTKVDNLEGSKLEIQVDLVALHGQVSSISSQLAKLNVLDAISTILDKVVAAMDRALGKITNYDVLTRGKGLINLKVYKDDGSTEIIYNFKISDPHVGKWKEVLDAFPKRTGACQNIIYTQMRQKLNDIHKTKQDGFAAVLAVLITGASQSRQHGKSEPDLTSHLPQSLFDVGSGRISIVIVNTF
ncbi:hypothetical protein Tco_0900316 [Tanacetum coccineum]